MSAAPGPAPATPRPRPLPQHQVPGAAQARLSLVPAAGTRASSGTFVLLLAGLLGLGLLGLLAVNTLLAQGAFTTSALAARQDKLAEHEQQLQQEVALLQSPQQLAAAATALGMVGTHNPVFIDTRTGKILGIPQAAQRTAPAATTSAAVTTAPSATGAATAAPTATAGATAKPSGQPGATTEPKPSPRPSPTASR